MKAFGLILLALSTSGLVVQAGGEPAKMSRALLHNSVRIECTTQGGPSIGTGFFYYFRGEETNTVCPVVVTCWHVIAKSSVGRLYFALGSSNALSRAADHFTATIPEFECQWIRHPDTNVDLAVLPLAPIMTLLEQNNKRLDMAPMSADLIPKDSELVNYGVFQEIKFIGYPIGLWDERNNLPIVRRGMTATDPVIDYNGREEFLIDASVLPGSSGSPVYIADDNGSMLGTSFVGPQLKFLGILFAVHEYTADEKIEIIPIPTAFDLKGKTHIPSGIGLVIKAERMNDFKPLLEEIQKKAANMSKPAAAGK